jgi:hypothetical protein
MSYEWDSRRARRLHLAKLAFGLLSAIVIIGIPVWIAVTMIGV